MDEVSHYICRLIHLHPCMKMHDPGVHMNAHFHSTALIVHNNNYHTEWRVFTFIYIDGKWMESLSAKMVDNPTYGQSSESGSVIYEAPKRTSLEATVLILDNPIYGEDADYNPVNYETIRDVQNPIYGDNARVDSNTPLTKST